MDLSYGSLSSYLMPQPQAPAQAAAGASPDGLGAHIAPSPKRPGLGAFDSALGAPLDFMEPSDTSPQAATRSAGFTALAAALGFGIGLAAGGPWGGVSGILFSGSAFNLNRAQKWWSSRNPSEKHEAVVSGIMGLASLTFGGYTAYKAYKSREAR